FFEEDRPFQVAPLLTNSTITCAGRHPASRPSCQRAAISPHFPIKKSAPLHQKGADCLIIRYP
ncbi:hypothetical protein ACFQ5D_24505, partial [Paenibacillus farraposensis]